MLQTRYKPVCSIYVCTHYVKLIINYLKKFQEIIKLYKNLIVINNYKLDPLVSRRVHIIIKFKSVTI
jgi:hypothetical protein